MYHPCINKQKIFLFTALLYTKNNDFFTQVLQSLNFWSVWALWPTDYYYSQPSYLSTKLQVVWIFMCLFKCCFWTKLLPQMLQECGFSPVWSFTWVCSVDLWLNFLPHVLHEYGFSPVWLLTWVFIPDFWMNLFPQVLQEYRFSPVWTLLWAMIPERSVNLFPQVLQQCGFSPVWILRWRCNSGFRPKLFPQVLQVNGFSPVCVLKWRFKFDFWMNPLPQVVQQCGFSPVWTLKCAVRLDVCKVFPQISHCTYFFTLSDLLWLSDTVVLSKLWLCFLFFSSAFLLDPESTCFSSWSWLSASGELWKRSCSLFDSGSLWSLSS